MTPLWDTFEYQPHQLEGIQWMLERETADYPGGILCDEMGLGKTIQMLGLILETLLDTTLLVAPLSVLAQWEQTAEKAGIQVWKSHSVRHEWIAPRDFDPDLPSLYLLNYERAVLRTGLITQTVWSRVIFDEAHLIGNKKTNRYKCCKKIKADNKWFLTATPITNKVENALALFEILGHTKLSTSLVALKPLIASTVLCRRMEDLRSTIPSLPQAAVSVKHSLDFETEEEAEFYRGIQGVIQRRWKMLNEEAGGQTERFRMIIRLRQISIHPQVYIAARKRTWAKYDRADFLDPSTKFIQLRRLIEEERHQNHRWLVFSHFHEEMTLLQDYLFGCPAVRNCGMYSGKLSSSEREEVLNQSKLPLQGSQQEVLLVQLLAGGVGLNLQHFDRVVFMGPWWTAASIDQAIGRAVRIGQTEKVIVHHLVLKEEETMNIDRMMLEKAEQKRSLCETFLREAKGQEKQSYS